MTVASTLTEPASASDPSTLAGMILLLVLLGIGLAISIWADMDTNPDFVTITDHRQLLDGLARSVAAHPANWRARLTCRFCGAPVDPYAPGGETGLCQSVECFDLAVAEMDCES